MQLSAALTPIVDFVFPPRCPLCGSPVAAHGGLCLSCWDTLVVPTGNCCKLCQRPMGEENGIEADLVCAPCMAEPPKHSGIAAATLYNAPSRALVLALKHGKRIGLVPMMARMIMPRLGGLEGDWVIVPVPLHRWRLMRRGLQSVCPACAGTGAADGAKVACRRPGSAQGNAFARWPQSQGTCPGAQWRDPGEPPGDRDSVRGPGLAG